MYVCMYILRCYKRIQLSVFFNNLIAFVWGFLKWKKGNIISTPVFNEISKLYSNTSIK